MQFRSSVDVSADKREGLVEALNKLLANAVDMFTQAKQAHWNVKGRRFISVHQLFDDLAKHARHQGDELAERIATLGGYARGTARQAAQGSALPEFGPDTLSGQDCLQALVERLATQASTLREALERCGDELQDPATEDLLTQMLREVEFDMWFLESHLEEPRHAYQPVQDEGESIQPS